jgi:hypothetical protein
MDDNHGCYRCIKPGVYPWPCKGSPDRTLEIFDDDVLTRCERGWMKHTGLACIGIKIPEDCMELWEEEPHLTLI